MRYVSHPNRMLMGFLFSLCFCLGCAEVSPSKPTNEAQSRVAHFVNVLSNGRVGKIEILQIPASIDTNAMVTPQQLRQEPIYRLTLLDGRFRLPRGFVEAMNSLVVYRTEREREVRWGVDFYDLAGVHIGGVYLSHWGGFGFVDDLPVVVDGKFLSWLEQRFGDCFK